MFYLIFIYKAKVLERMPMSKDMIGSLESFITFAQIYRKIRQYMIV